MGRDRSARLGVNAIKSWLTGSFPEIWLFASGGLFIAITLFLPKGVAGALTGLWPRRRAAQPAAPALAAARGPRR